jgi:LPXTG-motif cell wall-anchored protein
MKTFKHAKVLGMLVLAALLLALILPQGSVAYAAEYEPLEVPFVYKHVYTTTDTAVDSLFHYTISAKDGAPLPAEADADGVFSFQGVAGDGEKDGNDTRFDLDGVLTFTFTKPGVYTYEVKADLDTDSQKADAERYTFDPRIYTLNFYIANAREGGMKLEMLTAEKDNDVKPNQVELDPAYAGPVAPPPQPEPPAPQPTPAPTPTPAPAPTPAPTPKTGDTSNLPLYGAALLLSGAGIIVLLTKKKGREDNA